LVDAVGRGYQRNDDGNAGDRRIFHVPQRKKTICIMRRRPVAQKAGRCGEGGVALITRHKA
jgi:hypothetical protein